MNSIDWKDLILRVLVALLISIATTDARKPRVKCFHDMSDALSHMHQHLPSHLSMDDKCKRYAVLALDAKTYLNPNEQTSENVLALDTDELDELYREMGSEQKMSLFMSVIDRYRATQLAPAFLDIVECLSLIDAPEAEAFVNHEELTLISDMYKRLLGRQDLQMDISAVNLTTFSSAFISALGNLFTGYYDINTSRQPHIILTSFGADGKSVSKLIASTSTSHHKSSRLSPDEVTFRRRERARLERRRKRFLEPDRVRELDRKHHADKRTRQEKHDEYDMILSLPSTSFRDVQVKWDLLRRRQLHRRNQLRQHDLKGPVHSQEQRQDQHDQPDPLSDVGENRREKSISPNVENPRTELWSEIDPEAVYFPSLAPQPANSETPISEYDIDQFIDNLLQHPSSQPTASLEQYQRTDNFNIEPTPQPDLMSTIHAFEPESSEDHRIHQDLLDSAMQSDDIESIMRLISDGP